MHPSSFLYIDLEDLFNCPLVHGTNICKKSGFEPLTLKNTAWPAILATGTNNLSYLKVANLSDLLPEGSQSEQHPT